MPVGSDVDIEDNLEFQDHDGSNNPDLNRLEYLLQELQEGLAILGQARAGLSGIRRYVLKLQSLVLEAAEGIRSESLTRMMLDRVKKDLNGLARSTQYQGRSLLNGQFHVRFPTESDDQYISLYLNNAGGYGLAGLRLQDLDVNDRQQGLTCGCQIRGEAGDVITTVSDRSGAFEGLMISVDGEPFRHLGWVSFVGTSYVNASCLSSLIRLTSSASHAVRAQTISGNAVLAFERSASIQFQLAPGADEEKISSLTGLSPFQLGTAEVVPPTTLLDMALETLSEVEKELRSLTSKLQRIQRSVTQKKALQLARHIAAITKQAARQIQQNGADALRSCRHANPGVALNLLCQQTFSLHTSQLVAELKHGLLDDQFELYFQPKVRLSDGCVMGAEAFLRWRHPDRGVLTAKDFLPIAEESGLILPLGEWVIRHACMQLRQWEKSDYHGLSLSINLSSSQFQQADLVPLIECIIAETGIDPRYLELELTENMLMADNLNVVAKLQGLRDLGLSLSIDDFGTGYSSLAQLKKLPIQSLKIDGSLIRALDAGASEVSVVEATIAMATSLNLNVIAEGVEKGAQMEVLNHFRCQEGQGFLFARPMASPAFLHFLENRTIHLSGGFMPA